MIENERMRYLNEGGNPPNRGLLQMLPQNAEVGREERVHEIMG